MYNLIEEGGVYITKAELFDRTGPEKQEEILCVFDPGCAFTLINTDIIDALGYSIRKDGTKISKLNGAIGSSKGYVIKVPMFRCLGQELLG